MRYTLLRTRAYARLVKALPLVLAISAAAVPHRALYSQATDTTLRRLEIERVAAEVKKIDAERQKLVAEQGSYTFAGGLGVAGVAAVLSAVTTLIAVISLLAGGFKYLNDRQREREQRDRDREQRAHERFAAALAALGSEQPAARAAAAVTLETFADYGAYPLLRERAVRVLVAHLRFDTDDALQPTLATALSTLARGTALNGLDVRNADLTGVTLEGATLDGADFTGSKLDRACFRGASLRDARFGQTRGETVEFDRVQLGRASFQGTTLKDVTFTAAELDDADFTDAELVRWNFGGASLRGARFESGRFLAVTFGNARLDGAVFRDIPTYDPPTLRSLSGAGVANATVDEALSQALRQLPPAAGP